MTKKQISKIATNIVNYINEDLGVWDSKMYTQKEDIIEIIKETV